MLEVFMSKQVGCTPHLVAFGELSYIYSASASVAWQSLLLAPISIVRPLHCLMVKLHVVVRLSYVFDFSIKTYIIILFAIQSAKTVAHAQVVRGSWNSWIEKRCNLIAWFGAWVSSWFDVFMLGRLSVQCLSWLSVYGLLSLAFLSWKGNDCLFACSCISVSMSNW